ncbi:hypothetical protein ACFFX0_28775 [Citricoccus parietis]|uniref:Uncharacterized protein n=1 Tax=Citricoccus parietis TaxID=592307 RepID=A0ABV5G7H0_9MICC
MGIARKAVRAAGQWRISGGSSRRRCCPWRTRSPATRCSPARRPR